MEFFLPGLHFSLYIDRVLMNLVVSCFVARQLKSLVFQERRPFPVSSKCDSSFWTRMPVCLSVETMPYNIGFIFMLRTIYWTIKMVECRRRRGKLISPFAPLVCSWTGRADNCVSPFAKPRTAMVCGRMLPQCLHDLMTVFNCTCHVALRWMIVMNCVSERIRNETAVTRLKIIPQHSLRGPSVVGRDSGRRGLLGAVGTFISGKETQMFLILPGFWQRSSVIEGDP